MNERRNEQRHRSLHGGKIIFNNRRSVIDCLVRNLSDNGTCLQLNSTVGIPTTFDLLIDGEEASRPCQLIWSSDNRAGVSFRAMPSDQNTTNAHSGDQSPATSASLHSDNRDRQNLDIYRSEMLALRAALDEISVGVVLLDSETRAQFINRAFRRMWRLPDAKADSKPPFISLMYHGCETRAYAIPSADLDAYVAERVARVKAGDGKPLDLRLANGEVVRLQCTVLPAGGRMLCYTYVTDIVAHSDELEMLRAALDSVQQGVILLDPFLNAQFMNRAVRDLWKVSDEQANRKPPYLELVNDSRTTGTYGVPAEELEKFISNRVALARAGDLTAIDIPHSDGRIIRSQCAILPGGGRMLTYTDVTDLVHRANLFEQLATVDCMTGLFNRRHFDAAAEAEWNRFQRYHRPLSLLAIDIDYLKQINDGHGHQVGDRAIVHIAALCSEDKRSSDIVARLGGDEFAVVLPETDQAQAHFVAERLRQKITQRPLTQNANHETGIALTVSIGVATATVSMSSFAALMKVADQALYRAKAIGRNCIAFGEYTVASEYQAAAE